MADHRPDSMPAMPSCELWRPAMVGDDDGSLRDATSPGNTLETAFSIIKIGLLDLNRLALVVM